MDVDNIEREWLDVARFAVYTSTLSYISTTLQLMVDEDEFSIYIIKEGLALNDRSRAMYSACKGILDESSETPFRLDASISMVLELVGEISAARKLPAIVLPWEPNSEAHNPILGINALVLIVLEEPIQDDVDLDNQFAKVGDPNPNWANSAKALESSSEAQT
ncbi:hypothetical protein Ancab_034514 [Ancistrocladus abbreviatus]